EPHNDAAQLALLEISQLFLVKRYGFIFFWLWPTLNDPFSRALRKIRTFEKWRRIEERVRDALPQYVPETERLYGDEKKVLLLLARCTVNIYSLLSRGLLGLGLPINRHPKNFGHQRRG